MGSGEDFEKKRMMGLEPTTFCMARNHRHATRDDTSRQTA
jgi:hypothetical protein